MAIFIRIIIIKLNKHLDVPLTSNINEETGVRDFTSQMDNQIIYIDKVGLEDLITFHEAEFEIIGGYHYNHGRNETINHVIEYLQYLRLKVANDENPAQMVITLLMKLYVRKTIIKPIETDTVVKDNQKGFEKYMSL